MSRIDQLLSGVSTFLYEEEIVGLSEFEALLGGTATLDYFADKGIIEFSGRNQLKLTFVGAIVANRKVIYILPKYSSPLESNLQIDQSYYIRTIKKYVEYSARRSARKPVKEYLEDISLLMRTFDNLDGYFQRYGAFKERLSVFTKGGRGKISWARTIQDMVPVHVTSETDGGIHKPASVSETVFYPTPVHHAISQKEGIISLIFRNVLTLLASIITPLLDRPHPLCLSMRQDGVAMLLATLDERRPYYTRVIAQQVPKEFGYRRTVLSSLLAFLRAEASILDGAIRHKAFAFGVRKFSSVWEDACVRAVGGERGSHQLAKIVWRPRFGDSGEYQSRIDAKISSADGAQTRLIDAKYYLISKTDAESSDAVEKFIPVHDIVKQFGYMVAYHLGTGIDLNHIDSAFICPAPGASNFHYIGRIAFESLLMEQPINLASVRPIEVYGVSPSYLFDAYIEDRLLPDLIKFLDADHDVVEKIARIRRQRIHFSIRMRKDEKGVRIVGSEGECRIPWLDGNQVARLKSMAKDQGVSKIVDDMNRKRVNRDQGGFLIRNDEVVQSFEAARYLLGGDNAKARRLVEISDLLLNPSAHSKL